MRDTSAVIIYKLKIYLLYLLRYCFLCRIAYYRLFFKEIKISPDAEINILDGYFTFKKNCEVGTRSKIEISNNSCLNFEESVKISRDCLIKPSGCKAKIGRNTRVQDGCRLQGEFIIGRDCILAPNVFTHSGNHEFQRIPQFPIYVQDRLFAHTKTNKGVTIEDDCWIGTRVSIMGGIKIGKGSVIGANSVVTRDIEPYSIAVGSPAKVIKKRLSFEPKSFIAATNIEDLPYFYSGFSYDFLICSNEIGGYGTDSLRLASSQFCVVLKTLLEHKRIVVCLVSESDTETKLIYLDAAIAIMPKQKTKIFFELSHNEVLASYRKYDFLILGDYEKIAVISAELL